MPKPQDSLHTATSPLARSPMKQLDMRDSFANKNLPAFRGAVATATSFNLRSMGTLLWDPSSIFSSPCSYDGKPPSLNQETWQFFEAFITGYVGKDIHKEPDLSAFWAIEDFLASVLVRGKCNYEWQLLNNVMSGCNLDSSVSLDFNVEVCRPYIPIASFDFLHSCDFVILSACEACLKTMMPEEAKPRGKLDFIDYSCHPARYKTEDYDISREEKVRMQKVKDYNYKLWMRLPLHTRIATALEHEHPWEVAQVESLRSEHVLVKIQGKLGVLRKERERKREQATHRIVLQDDTIDMDAATVCGNDE